jgi:hypothetical protein
MVDKAEEVPWTAVSVTVALSTAGLVDANRVAPRPESVSRVKS